MCVALSCGISGNLLQQPKQVHSAPLSPEELQVVGSLNSQAFNFSTYELLSRRALQSCLPLSPTSRQEVTQTNLAFSSCFNKDKTWMDEKAEDLQMFVPWGPLCWLIIHVCFPWCDQQINHLLRMYYFIAHQITLSSSVYFIWATLWRTGAEVGVMKPKPGWKVSSVGPAKTDKSKPKVTKPLLWEKQAVAIFILLLWTFFFLYFIIFLQ